MFVIQCLLRQKCYQRYVANYYLILILSTLTCNKAWYFALHSMWHLIINAWRVFSIILPQRPKLLGINLSHRACCYVHGHHGNHLLLDNGQSMTKMTILYSCEHWWFVRLKRFSLTPVYFWEPRGINMK